MSAWFGLNPTAPDAWGARLIAKEVESGLPGCVLGCVSVQGTEPSSHVKEEALSLVGHAIVNCLDEGWETISGWTLRWKRPYHPGGYVYLVVEGTGAGAPEGESLSVQLDRLEAEEERARTEAEAEVERLRDLGYYERLNYEGEEEECEDCQECDSY